jgi:hypothetical protein
MMEPVPNEAKANESSFAGLTPYPGNPFLISEVGCSECEQIRPGIKSYWVTYLIFVLVKVIPRIDPMVKCPACMRRFLLQRILLALLLANLFSPIVLLWWVVLFIRTFLP